MRSWTRLGKVAAGCCRARCASKRGNGSLDAPRSATKCIQQTVLYAETAPERGGARARQAPASNRPAVLPDGSYASQTALADTFAGAAAHGAAAAPNLRTLLLAGDFFLGAVVAGAPAPLPACRSCQHSLCTLHQLLLQGPVSSAEDCPGIHVHASDPISGLEMPM